MPESQEKQTSGVDKGVGPGELVLFHAAVLQFLRLLSK